MPRSSPASFHQLNERIINCEHCPRLRSYGDEVAVAKRRAYADWTYWGRPVPNFGDPRARLLVVGLAPAAHGGHRTGRVFTGDRSGDWLYRALHEAGFANQPTSEHIDDGLELTDCAITAACHCAPPANKPLPSELAACREHLDATIDVLPVRVILCLGQIAWKAMLEYAREHGWLTEKPPKFAHGCATPLTEGRWLMASYHPSQQNTFTGVLTEEMFRQVFTDVRTRLA